MTVYNENTDHWTWAVKQARETREQLDELNIKSPDTSKMLQLKVNETTFFFHTKSKLENFKAKHKKELAKAERIGQSFFIKDEL